MAQDGILPARFTRLSDKQIPVNAIALVLLISLPLPFVGRTAIGWIVDTTTIGATILYGFASAAVFKAAKQEGSKKDRLLGGVCLIILLVFLVFLLFPSLFSDHTIETETYALMTVWSLVGLFYFHAVIRRDHARHFGKAIVVWMALLAVIFLMAMTWTERTSERRGNGIRRGKAQRRRCIYDSGGTPAAKGDCAANSGEARPCAGVAVWLTRKGRRAARQRL